MTDAQKKITAAIVAAIHFLKVEEELAALQVAAAGAAMSASAGPKLWALNGRQMQMQLRNLMQLRAIGRMQ
jgi:hypothetical protein